MVAFILTTVFDFSISFLVIKYITSAAGFLTMLYETPVGAFYFGCFNNSGHDRFSQSAICYLKSFLGFLVELPFLSGLIF